MIMKEYKYPTWIRVFSLIPLIFLLFGLSFCIDWIALNLGIINDTLFGDNATINYDYYLQGGLVMMFMGLFFLVRTNEFQIENDGIKVSIFFLFWVFIPWEDVLEITTLKLPGYSNPNMIRVLRVRNLTIFHRLASFLYFAGLHPIMIISNQLINFEDFINTIETKLESRNA